MYTIYRGFFVLAFLLILSSVVQGRAENELSAVQAQTTDPVLVGAGDIVSCSRTEDEETAKLLDRIEGTVFTLGDNAYPDGTLEQFNNCYGPTWGRHKDRIRPSVGNHEYQTPGAAGYFTYFGSAASPLDTNCTSDCKGYYSYNLGDWHIIVLNNEMPHEAGSDQELWLRRDLEANQTTCTLAYWHEPRFSSGQHGNNFRAAPFWQALYDFGADVVLNGHDHTYERFGLQNPSGQADPNRGMREFVVGTGGAALYTFPAIQPNSEVRNNTTWGVLKLTLHATSYSWEFIPIAGQTFTDSGSANCVTTPPPTNHPPVAVDDNASTSEDGAVLIAVAANDSDPDGNLDPNSTNITCASCAGPANGVLVNNGDGSFTYTPNLDFYDSDSFVYEICDAFGACDTATVSITVNRADQIFSHGFESGDFSAWSSSNTDNGDLSVSAAAALVGSNGMHAVIDDNIVIFVTDDTPNAEPRYRARFYFDPNSITMVNGDNHMIFGGYSGTSTMVLRIPFRKYSNNYQVRAAMINDGTSWTNINWFTISDAPHYIEIDWRAATAAGANNGGLTFWIDGVQKANLSGIDNDTRRIDQVRLGAVNGIDNGTRGTYFFDAFESRRETYIGPAGLTADFSGDPTQGSATLTVNFTNLSQPTDRITAYLWDFGDGITSTEANPSHAYTADGVYTVSLTAYSDLGEDTEIKANYINVSTGTDLIFRDGFESANFSAWTSCVTDVSDLSVTSSAALVASYGMQALLSDNVGIYCRDDNPNAEPRYRARLYFDTNSITMVNGDNHMIFIGYSGTSTQVVRVLFRRSSNTYQVRAALNNDSTTWTNTSWFTIADAPHALEIDWKASTAAGANNGGLTLWIDGVQKASLTGIDNDTRKIDQVRLGAVNGIDAGTRGTYYFDAFESRRETYIGP